MKKKILILFFIFLLTFSIENVLAENKLKYENNDGYYIVVDKDNLEKEFDKEKDEYIYYKIEEFSLPDVHSKIELTDVKFVADKDDQAVINPEKWWAQMIVCVDASTSDMFNNFMNWFWKLEDWDNYEYAVILTDSMLIDEQNFGHLGDDKISWYEMLYLGGDATKCINLTPDLNSVSKSDLISSCTFYDNTLFSINKLLNTYDSKNGSEKIQILNEYNRYIDTLKNACNTVIEYQDYNDTCLLRCNGLQEDLDNWSNIVGSNSKNGECGFSARLMVWISNILRWIKYILPVAVIVLGILDFIKAIVSDNADQMKKAQGHFIKRLIAAALVFIIPLIIEFILDKMGFGYNDCGLF